MMHRLSGRVSPGMMRMSSRGGSGTGFARVMPPLLSGTPQRRAGLPRSACGNSSHQPPKDHCAAKSPAAPAPVPPLTSRAFWGSGRAWRRAAVNTLRCLVGCTAGDFSAMWYLQAFHGGLGLGTIMAISMASGITTSLALETVLLRRGPDRLPWPAAARTAAGMSLISMATMEAAENAVDWHLTGGLVDLGSPAFWAAAAASAGAGFLAPLPYNYVRLRRFGRGCH